MKHFLEDTFDFIRYVLFEPVIVFLAILLGLCFYAINENEKRKFSPEVHQAWTQTNPDHQMSYEQWVRLYKSGVLPGQQPQPNSPIMYPVVVPVPIR